MEISVRFRLRPVAGGSTSHDGMQVIQARITMDGVEDSGFSTGIRISPLHWDQARQRVTLRNDPDRVQERLDQIKADVKRVYRLKRDMHEQGLGPVVTIGLVKAAYRDWRNPDAGLLDRAPGMVPIRECLDRYVAHLRTRQGQPGGLSEKTLNDRARVTRYVSAYLSERNKTEPMAATITPVWVDEFRFYLYSSKGLKRKASTLNANTVWMIVNELHRAVAYVHRQDGGFLNPLQGISHSKGPQKEVYFLGPDHLNALFSDELTEQLGQVEKPRHGRTPDPARILAALWWVRLMCLTGLDYPDAQRYAADPAQFEREGPAGRKIVIRRTKPPRNECNIPIDGVTGERLGRLLSGPVPPVLTPWALWELCVAIGYKIGFDKPLTPKICRKSAGAAFLLDDITLEGVSNILGHASPRTTSAHYVKITGHIVDRDMARRAAKRREQEGQ